MSEWVNFTSMPKPQSMITAYYEIKKQTQEKLELPSTLNWKLRSAAIVQLVLAITAVGNNALKNSSVLS